MSDIDLVPKIDEIAAKIGNLCQGIALQEQRLHSVENSIQELMKSHSMLVELRTEATHIMKQLASNKGDFDEVFQRLRALEQAPAQCATACGNKERVSALERNQRWGVVSILSFVLMSVLYAVFGKS